MCHTGYHPTGCRATADFGPTKYRYTLMAIKNHRVLKKQKQRESNTRENDDSRNTKSAQEHPKKERA